MNKPEVAKMTKVGQKESRNSGGGVEFLCPAGATSRQEDKKNIRICKADEVFFKLK